MFQYGLKVFLKILILETMFLTQLEISKSIAAILEMPQYVAYQNGLFILCTKSQAFNRFLHNNVSFICLALRWAESRQHFFCRHVLEYHLKYISFNTAQLFDQNDYK